MLVPNGWKSRKLGEICKIKTGNKNNDDKIENGLYPFFVRSQNIERINSYLYEGEAILVPGEGRIGEVFHYVNGRFDCHQRVYRITNFLDSIISKYIYYFLGHNFKKQAVKYSVKVTVDSLRLPIFQTFKVLIPPLLEQKAIVGILSTWDKVILQLSKLIEAKRQRKKALMQRLLTGKQRLPGFDEEWKEVRISEMVKRNEIRIERGKALSRAALIPGSIPVIAGGKTTPYFHNQATHTHECITVSASGSAGYVWHHNYPIWASDCIVIFSLRGSTSFLFYVLSNIQRQIYKLQSGGAQPHVYTSDLKSLYIPDLSLPEQTPIATILSTADSEINQLEQKLDTYREQKKGLMQQLLTGKKRVRLKHKEVV